MMKMRIRMMRMMMKNMKKNKSKRDISLRKIKNPNPKSRRNQPKLRKKKVIKKDRIAQYLIKAWLRLLKVSKLLLMQTTKNGKGNSKKL
jgi:hypothetical protein